MNVPSNLLFNFGAGVCLIGVGAYLISGWKRGRKDLPGYMAAYRDLHDAIRKAQTSENLDQLDLDVLEFYEAHKAENIHAVYDLSIRLQKNIIEKYSELKNQVDRNHKKLFDSFLS